MSVFSSRCAGPRRHVVARPRAGLAVLVAIGLLLVSGCGFGAQTLRPYTPAEGVNFDVGDLNVPDSVVHVRNLLIISRSPGSGIVSASLSAVGSDTLIGISGTAYQEHGIQGTPFTVPLTGPIPLTGNNLVVLTQRTPLITFTSPDLQAGLSADVTMKFAQAGSDTRRVPVYDGNREPYTDIVPSPPAGSPS